MAIKKRQSEPGLIVDPTAVVKMPAASSGFASVAISDVSCPLSIEWRTLCVEICLINFEKILS